MPVLSKYQTKGSCVPFCQGRKPRGIFGVAQISGPAELNPDRHPGKQPTWYRFDLNCWLTPSEIDRIREGPQALGRCPLEYQASGVRLSERAAREIDKRLGVAQVSHPAQLPLIVTRGL